MPTNFQTICVSETETKETKRIFGGKNCDKKKRNVMGMAMGTVLIISGKE